MSMSATVSWLVQAARGWRRRQARPWRGADRQLLLRGCCRMHGRTVIHMASQLPRQVLLPSETCIDLASWQRSGAPQQ